MVPDGLGVPPWAGRWSVQRSSIGRRPWRRAVAIVGYVLYGLLCLATAALALVGALHLYYVTLPLPEPVSWSCPAEWVVMPGDTLWRIAQTCWPGRDPRPYIDRIKAMNPGVRSEALRVGQTLRLPVDTEVAGGAE